MKLTRTPFVASALLLSTFVTAEDVLVSKRNLQKRFIDSDGNYNICKSIVHINYPTNPSQLFTTSMMSTLTLMSSDPVVRIVRIL